MSASACKHALRRLELDAYSSVVSALRAQGDLSIDKRRLLKDLQGSLRIPSERHRAEVRRAVNDDRLKAIADMVSDDVNVSAGWQLEGRRLMPVLPRLMAQSCKSSTVFFTANKSSDQVKMQMNFEERYDQKTYNCKSGESPVRRRGRAFDDILHNESLLTIELTKESVPRETFLWDSNYDDSSDLCESISEQKHQSSVALLNQENGNKIVQLSVESGGFSANSGSSHSSNVGFVVHHVSQANPLSQVTIVQPQVSQPTMSPIVQQGLDINQQLFQNTVANITSQNSTPHTSHVSQIQSSYQVSVVSQSSTAMPVLMARCASASAARLSSHNIKSGPTPKVIIVSGTGMSTATTISGPPPPVSSAISLTPKPSPNKLNVTSIQKTDSELQASIASTASSIGTGSAQSSISTVCTGSVQHAVNTLHSAARLFSPRNVPIIRPRLSTLTARIRTSQHSSCLNNAMPSIVTTAPTSLATAGLQSTRNLQKVLSTSTSAGSSSPSPSQSLNIQLKNVKLMTPTIQMRQDSVDKKILTQTFQATTGGTMAIKTTYGLPTTVVPTVFVKASQALYGTNTTSPLAKLSQTSQALTRTHTAVSRVTQALQVITTSPLAKGTQALQVLATCAIPPASVVVTTSCQTSTNVVPKIIPKSGPLVSTAHLTTSGGRIILSDSGGARRNVIVVQKPSSADRSSSSLDLSSVTSVTASPFEKELVNFIQQQDLQQNQLSASQSIKKSTEVVKVTSASSLPSYAAQDELDFTTAPFLDCAFDSYDSVVEFRASKNSADISTDSADSDELGHASDNGDLNTAVTDSEALVTCSSCWSTSGKNESVSSHGILPIFVEQSLVEDSASRDVLQLTSAECNDDSSLVMSSNSKFISLTSGQSSMEPSSEATEYFSCVLQPSVASIETLSVSEKLVCEGLETVKACVADLYVPGPSDIEQMRFSILSHSAATSSYVHSTLSGSHANLKFELNSSLETGAVVNNVERPVSYNNKGIELQTLSEPSACFGDLHLPISETLDHPTLKFEFPSGDTEIITESNAGDSIGCTLQSSSEAKVTSSVSAVDQFDSETNDAILVESLSETSDKCDTGLIVEQPVFQSQSVFSSLQIPVSESIYEFSLESNEIPMNSENNVDCLLQKNDDTFLKVEMLQKNDVNLTVGLASDSQSFSGLMAIENSDISKTIEFASAIKMCDINQPVIDIVALDDHVMDRDSQSVYAEQVYGSTASLANESALSNCEVSLQNVSSPSCPVSTWESDVNSVASNTAIAESQCKSELLFGNQFVHAIKLTSNETVNYETPPSGVSCNELHSLSSILGKRKRKPSSLPDELESSPSVTGWNRQALTLLGRVMRFRNMTGDKNKSNPAAWFNQPVDAGEVPDYYDIIKHPMDFGAIKKKLETGMYNDWSNFHTDMLLVRDNCHLYNATGTQVRHDCDLVFNFYEQEISKNVNKIPLQGCQGSDKKRKLE